MLNSNLIVLQSGSRLLYLMFSLYRTVWLWSLCLFSCLCACSYIPFQISSLCLLLQEQALKTVLEISLLVPLLIFLLHEGNSQIWFVAELRNHCRPAQEDVALINTGFLHLSLCDLNIVSENVRFESKSIIYLLYHFSTVIATEQTGKLMLGLHLPFDPNICPKYP